MADEKTVEVELLDDYMKMDSVFYSKGDKVTLPKSTYDDLVKFGSVREWANKDKQSSATKAARSTEGQAEKSAKDDAEATEQRTETTQHTETTHRTEPAQTAPAAKQTQQRR